MAIPILNDELEQRKEAAKELIVAGGCYAIQYWSNTDAQRLCPKKYSPIEKLEPPIYTDEWISAGEKAIELIQKGINLLKN